MVKKYKCTAINMTLYLIKGLRFAYRSGCQKGCNGLPWWCSG